RNSGRKPRMPLLNENARRFLPCLARRELERAIQLAHLAAPEQIPAGVHDHLGAFVTLRTAAGLRGCVGRVEAAAPLYQTIRECTIGAAIHDPRFDPVRRDEVADLWIEISVLSSLQQVQPGQIEIGRHGLVVSQGEQRGLLLPQVAAEWGWDSIRFLEETCAKAGLPRNAWRLGAYVQAFNAQVFQEQEPCELADLGLEQRRGA
ncbi:MAG: AmmeMemoRadiSam system protein A, partial [Terriglobia bacterium]